MQLDVPKEVAAHVRWNRAILHLAIVFGNVISNLLQMGSQHRLLHVGHQLEDGGRGNRVPAQGLTDQTELRVELHSPLERAPACALLRGRVRKGGPGGDGLRLVLGSVLRQRNAQDVLQMNDYVLHIHVWCDLLC